MSESDSIPQDTSEILQELKHKQVAELLVADVSPTAIAKELGISRRQVNKIMASEDFKAHLRDLADQMVSTAVNQWKGAMLKRMEKTLEVLDYHLKKNNLEAVKIVIKSIGLEKTEPVQQSSNLTVVLPSMDNIKSVQSEVIDV